VINIGETVAHRRTGFDHISTLAHPASSQSVTRDETAAAAFHHHLKIEQVKPRRKSDDIAKSLPAAIEPRTTICL